jgi:hypothetical protein
MRPNGGKGPRLRPDLYAAIASAGQGTERQSRPSSCLFTCSRGVQLHPITLRAVTIESPQLACATPPGAIRRSVTTGSVGC